MDCAVCKAENAESAKYCSNCGARLDAAVNVDAATLQDAVRREVDAALKRDAKDLQIAEFDITERVATRLLGWAKSVGVVLGALLLVGGFLGVKSAIDVLADFRAETRSLVKRASDEVTPEIQRLKMDITGAQQDLQKLNAEKAQVSSEYAQLAQDLPQLKGIREQVAALGSQISDVGQGLDVLNQQVQALVRDEAGHANRSAQSFPAADEDYFHSMDGGGALTADEIKGRNTWMLWTGGNDRFWDSMANYSFGSIDLLKILSSHPSVRYSRDNRWSYFGLLNEPCFAKATGPNPSAFGLWLDTRRPDCPPDPFESEAKYRGVAEGARGRGELPVGSYYGLASGVVGLRLFPNPDFDEAAAKKWDPVRYYTDPSYYNSNTLVRPYRVGMSCAFCQVGPSPDKPPADPSNPQWENLGALVGNQYLWADRIFFSNGSSEFSNYIYQFMHTYRPGTFDTSLIVTDYINNPQAIPSIYNVGARLLATGNNDRWGDEVSSDDEPNVRLLPEQFRARRPSVAQLFADIKKFYLSTGVYSEETLRHQIPVLGGQRETPLTVKMLGTNSVYWKATLQQIPHITDFLIRASRPKKLVDAPGGAAYLAADASTLHRGKIVFADNCAGCHSSKGPPLRPANLPGCDGPGYLTCWQQYWNWTQTDDFKTQMQSIVLQEDFLNDNYLSNNMRIPITLLETNACISLSTNELGGAIWDNFSSESYKALPSVGSVTIYDPLTGEPRPYVMPSGGRGYMRVPSLVGIWATAPFLSDNSIGPFEASPSVDSRLRVFNASITQLLWPAKRPADPVFGKKIPGIIDRTTMESSIKIPGRYLPYFMRRSEAMSREGDLLIAAIPKGIPVSLLANIGLLPDTEDLAKRAEYENVVVTLVQRLNALPGSAADDEARTVFTTLDRPLMGLSKCPDFVTGRGHYFGSSLSDSDKRALIEFLKTF